MRVAYQGIPGAYSELALRRFFGPRAAAVPCPLSEQVFEAVETGAADRAILPIENTIAGPVAVNADLFLQRGVFAIGEAYLRIEHCLLGRGPLGRVRRAYSHPVALAQCRAFLQRRGIEAVPEYDTAGAAQLVAQRGRDDEAAIASEPCAQAYGLKALARRIQTHRENITRFLVFVRGSEAPKGLRMTKTTLAFVARHKPGALLSCLQLFADAKINLTRLESRPIPENPFAYVFHVDFVGGLNDAKVKGALQALRREAKSVKVIGSYPAASSIRSVSSQPKHLSVTETP